MHTTICYDAGRWHGQHTANGNEVLTPEDLAGHANACILSMIDDQELPDDLTHEQQCDCETAWVAGYLSAYAPRRAA